MGVAGGPVFEEMFTLLMLLNMDKQVCLQKGEPTLERFNNLFYDQELRNEMMRLCADKRVKLYIENARQMQGDWSWQNFAPYITSKIRKLVFDDIFKDIINADTTLDIRGIMDQGKILLVNLEKGYMGTDNVVYFGRLLLNGIFRHAISRADIPPAKRRPFYLFVDEFQNFSSGDIGSAMSEARKYGLALILANQTLGQLPDHTVQSLLGNVGSQVFFRPGLLDFERIKNFVKRDFSDEEVLNMPNFHAIARLLYENKPMQPFVVETIKTEEIAQHEK